MKKTRNGFVLMLAMMLVAIPVFGQTNQQSNKMEKPTPQVQICTNMGDIVVMLYDDTPIHRDNFLKLAREGFYDGTLFHRVILQVA